ncbi:hypothetical protein EYF80_061995 [Liparis tanakae]|uniref:Uncharacterized protein n=1 Tax=Liparis tanakae TaxID=230148 RepID=A0A4Z2EGH1_9TELE|nr:hypothetical protein EYF80_061995 [Liparis tanakae]
MRLRSGDHPEDLRAEPSPPPPPRLHALLCQVLQLAWQPPATSSAWHCQPSRAGRSTDGINKTYEGRNEKRAAGPNGAGERRSSAYGSKELR